MASEFSRKAIVSLLAATAVLAVWSGQRAHSQSAASRVIAPESLGFPEGNERTSQPFVVRRYKADPDDPEKAAKRQPAGFVKTIEDGYKLGEQEVVRVHEGVDVSSRPGPGKGPIPMDYKAGVYGRVIKAGGDAFNTVTVQLENGGVIQYLHSGKVKVEVGQIVTPMTVLGNTGKTGAAEIHLHIQARGRDGEPLHPDVAFTFGRTAPGQGIAWPAMKWVDFDIELSSPRKPKIKMVDGLVRFGYDENAVKSLAGTRWAEIPSSKPDSRFEHVFKAGGVLEAGIEYYKFSSDKGTWKQDDKKITWSLKGGNEFFRTSSVFEGTIQGDTISGTATDIFGDAAPLKREKLFHKLK